MYTVRSSLIAVSLLGALWSPGADAKESAPPAQIPAAFDAAGIVGMPVVTLGFLQLGRLIDDKRGAKSGLVSSTYTKLFFVVGTAAMYPAFYGLAEASHVPVTWGSAAAGFGLGTAVGLGLLGVDVGLMAGFNLDSKSTATGVLAFITVVGWSVACTLFIKADPFHLTRSLVPETGTMAQASAPLLSMTF